MKVVSFGLYKKMECSFYVSSNLYEWINVKNKGSHVDSYSGGSNEHSLVILPL